MAGFLVFLINVDYPHPCTLYILFMLVFCSTAFRVLYPYTPCWNKITVIFCLCNLNTTSIVLA